LPLYDYVCDHDGSFEAFRKVGDGASAPCPTCGATSARTFAATRFVIERAYDQAIDGEFPNADKPEVVARAGGGVAIKNKDNGAYRAAVTHNTQCPKENKWRNVAVLGEFPYGKRLNCEACGHLWIHQEATAPNPLKPGVDESARPGKSFYMSPDVPLCSGYTEPERGA
jgi:putative FmdB family regulatory protein